MELVVAVAGALILLAFLSLEWEDYRLRKHHH